MHNSGHDHNYSEGVDRVYSCAKCCFEEDLISRYDKNLACKICSQPAETLSSSELSYFYKTISFRFGAQYSIAEFLRPDSKIPDFTELEHALPADLSHFKVAIDDKLLASGTITKRTSNELNTTAQDRNFFSPLRDSLFLAKSGNHEDAAKKLLEFSGDTDNRHSGITGVVISLSRFILGHIDPNSTESRQIRQRFLSTYFEN